MWGVQWEWVEQLRKEHSLINIFLAPLLTILDSLLMFVEGDIKPGDECGHPGESSWEGGCAISDPETVHISYQSKIISPSLHCWASHHLPNFEDEDLGSSPGWWAATVATNCPNRPKLVSSNPCEWRDAQQCTLTCLIISSSVSCPIHLH